MNKVWLSSFWSGNKVFNEICCFAQDAKGNISGGKLLYAPEEVVSVTSTCGHTTYKEGKDYVVTAEGIARTEDSDIPLVSFDTYCRKIENEDVRWLERADDSSLFVLPADVYQNQVSVTYSHKGGEQYVKAPAQKERLPRILKKLEEKKPVNLVFYGDSITAGCEASGCDEFVIEVFSIAEYNLKMDRAPYMPAWPELVRQGLCEAFGYSEITKVNRAAGGSTSAWGVTNADGLLSPYTADAYVIGFGMNDNMKDENLYKEDIKTIIQKVRGYSPEADIILVSPMVANDEILTFTKGKSAEYEQKLWELSKEFENVAVAPVNSIFKDIRRKKTYYDITGNYVNHPNDFGVRVYAQAVLAVLGIEF